MTTQYKWKDAEKKEIYQNDDDAFETSMAEEEKKLAGYEQYLVAAETAVVDRRAIRDAQVAKIAEMKKQLNIAVVEI